jgi:hypothetical protein
MAQQSDEFLGHFDAHVRQVFGEFRANPQNVFDGWVCCFRLTSVQREVICGEIVAHHQA